MKQERKNIFTLFGFGLLNCLIFLIPSFFLALLIGNIGAKLLAPRDLPSGMTYEPGFAVLGFIGVLTPIIATVLSGFCIWLVFYKRREEVRQVVILRRYYIFIIILLVISLPYFLFRFIDPLFKPKFFPNNEKSMPIQRVYNQYSQ